MKVQGCDCSITIKTEYREFDVPYLQETIREAYSLLQEEAAIEGDGTCRAIRKSKGVTGCVVTPLSIETAPLLLYLAMGAAGLPVFVSETRNVYQYQLNLLPMEDTECFDLIQNRSGNNEQWQESNGQGTGIFANNKERRLFEGCRVKGFELRFEWEQPVRLKLDVYGGNSPVILSYKEIPETPLCQTSEMARGNEIFKDDNIFYKINGREYNNIYGTTIITKKEGGTKTEIWIKRFSDREKDIPEIIEEMIITASLLRDRYEERHFGKFRITIKSLVLISDETSIKSSGAVIGPLRYYVAGGVSAEVFTNGGEGIK